ncbi:BLUF domain-containing protein [Winogradskyella sp. PC-19]|uniref:BLUF domain-containing protein n=1 Tax=Winogradskyella sp. PC-19 TaxID=754417 RepID=UPI0012F7D920|nr:BLUF domain-containing protein [Winogradskyella sp. PC-19]
MKAIYYISNFSKDLSKHDIDKLIQTVNKKNKLLNVTGLLIIKNKHFFQILEGEDEKIDPLYEKIKMTLDIQVLLDC